MAQGSRRLVVHHSEYRAMMLITTLAPANIAETTAAIVAYSTEVLALRLARVGRNSSFDQPD
jgi:hypothetical protein